MRLLKKIKVPTGEIYTAEGEKGTLEFLTVGDYGKQANIKAERLQDISDEDCLREGIHVHNPDPSEPRFIGYAYDATPGTNRKRWWFKTPREAFSRLIDLLSGRGTWERNEWQFAYTFKLIK